MIKAMISHGPDGLWLSCYVHVGEHSQITAVTVLTIQEAQDLIIELHKGIAAEMSGMYGAPDRGKD